MAIEKCPLALSSGKKHFRAFRALYMFRRALELQASGVYYADALLKEPEDKMRKGVSECVVKCNGSVDTALQSLGEYLPPKHRNKHRVRGVVSSGMHGTVLALESPLYVIKITLQPEGTVKEEFEQQRAGHENHIAVEPIELVAWTEPSKGVRVCSILMERVDGTLYDILRNAWEWRDSIEAVCDGLVELFERMADSGFEHTDMHSENIGFLVCDDALRFVALDFDGSKFHQGRKGMSAHVSDLFGLLYDLSSQLGVFNKLYRTIGQDILDYAVDQKLLAGVRSPCPNVFSSRRAFKRRAMRLSSSSESTHVELEPPER